MCCRDAQTDRPQLRTRLLERHVRTQPAEHLEPSFAPRLQLRVGAKHRLHRDRSPENEAQPGGRSAETRWRDANYVQAVIVEQDLFADDARVSSEAPPPERIADHHDRRTAGPRRLLGREATTQQRPHAEHIEVIGRDQLPPHPLGWRGLAGLAQTEGLYARRDEPALEGPRLLAPVEVVSIGDDVLHSTAGTAEADPDEPGRLVDQGERMEHERVGPGENRRGRADAEAERERRCEREAGARAQRTEGVAEVTHTATPPSDRPSPPAERGDNSRSAKRPRAGLQRPRTSWDRSRRPRTGAPRADE